MRGARRLPTRDPAGCQPALRGSAAGGDRPRAKILAAREDFSWSAAVCAEHQPQQVGRRGSLGLTSAGEVLGPLRLVLGGHSRAPWVVAPPLWVHRVSVVFPPVPTEWKRLRNADLARWREAGCAGRSESRGGFSDAPLGHGHTQRANRGLRPLLRPCPRLMSCGVPPGRESDGRAVFIVSLCYIRIGSTE